MTGTEQIAVLYGWAMVPFIISVIYGCTSCGDKKVAPMKDILAIILGVGAFWGVSSVLQGTFADWTHWGVLLSGGLGYLAMHFTIMIAYKFIYAGMPETAAH
ncbi:MAG: hypothetical protein ACI97A_002101 [Planctomycetota bacterium]|jgi:hypothetical protein